MLTLIFLLLDSRKLVKDEEGVQRKFRTIWEGMFLGFFLTFCYEVFLFICSSQVAKRAKTKHQDHRKVTVRQVHHYMQLLNDAREEMASRRRTDTFILWYLLSSAREITRDRGKSSPPNDAWLFVIFLTDKQASIRPFNILYVNFI